MRKIYRIDLRIGIGSADLSGARVGVLAELLHCLPHAIGRTAAPHWHCVFAGSAPGKAALVAPAVDRDDAAEFVFGTVGSRRVEGQQAGDIRCGVGRARGLSQ